MRGVEYNRIDLPGNPRQIGVIAQEVEKVFPQVVKDNQTEQGTIKSVSYGNIIGALIEAIKELKQEVDSLKAQLDK